MIEPYYTDGQVTLYQGRMQDVLPQLGGQADLILTDPPYGETALEWDRWPAGWPALMAGYGRSMWCFGSMRMFLDRSEEFRGWKLSQDVVWEKQSGSGFAADRFKRVHENVLHWYRGSWSDVYHQTPRVPFTGVDRSGKVKRPPHRPEHTGVVGPNVYTTRDTRLVRSVIQHRNMNGLGTINATQKPTGLLTWLLQYACPPGGLVLDPFAGSTSTLIEARHLGMRAIGIEMREEQCEKAASWLAEVPAPDLFTELLNATR